MGSSRLALAGAFILGGVLLFAVGLFYIGDRRMLFGNTFRIHAEFANISGLENGATVRVAGMQGGEVEAIQVPAGPAGRFRVRIRLRDDLRPLVRHDSVASIQNDGLVGNKLVQIEPGTEAAAAVDDGGTIQSREPFDFTNLLQQLSDTITTISQTVLDVRVEVDAALKAIATTAQTAQSLIDEVGEDARSVLASGERVSQDLEAIIAGIREGKGNVGQLLTDDTIYQRAKAIAADAERAMANVRQATDEARAAIADFRGEEGPVRGLTGNLQQTLVSARDAMHDLAEATEALKRNFLFRGFFNRRGYFDLDDVTVQQYRAGALEAGDRRPLRIWIGSRVLFERGPDGQERISDGGRARLDSAMSQFVRYPRTSPFVIEGYAEAATDDERFLLSRSRAQLVRDYLVGKFGLDPTLTRIMPMGQEADGAPAGETWDGVALAMFVPTGGS